MFAFHILIILHILLVYILHIYIYISIYLTYLISIMRAMDINPPIAV